jgi:hypothetical protein
MKFLYAFGESGTLDFRNAVGQVGTVYLTVPARRGGPGQVRVIVQGRLKVVQAFTESPTPLPAQSKIKVSGLIDSRTLLVDPLGDTKEES